MKNTKSCAFHRSSGVGYGQFVASGSGNDCDFTPCYRNGGKRLPNILYLAALVAIALTPPFATSGGKSSEILPDRHFGAAIRLQAKAPSICGKWQDTAINGLKGARVASVAAAFQCG
jgi:hypothetical protein